MLASLAGSFSKLKKVFDGATTLFQGRSTLFAVFFTASAFLLAEQGKLSDQYVHVIFAVQGYVLGHSIKEDYFKPDCDHPKAPDTNL